jgi:hypothetical protein
MSVSALGRPASQSTFVEFPVPESVARTMLADLGFAKSASAFNFPMQITLGERASLQSPAPAADHLVLTDAQREALQAALAHEAQRSVLVFVLDTGYPDSTSYATSKLQLRQLVQFVQTQIFGKTLPSADVSKPFSDPSNHHCKDVARALAELRQLDPGGKIKIVYVPLTKEQNSDGILIDLLQTEWLRNYINYSDAKHPLSSDVRRRSKNAATDTVRHSFPDKWSGITVETDKSVLDAILDLGDFWARKNNTVFFVSESWTVPHGQYHVYYPSPLSGVVLSAVGNSGENITTNQREFADRSADHKDTIAILNLRPGQGLLCGSSFIDPRDVDSAMAVGFDGEILGDTLCGTSFAAPRIAWFLALDEATRKTALDPNRWELILGNRLLKARDPQASGFNKLWFDPTIFLTTTAN